MQTPPALPQLINSAEDWLCSPPCISPNLLDEDDDGGQIQGSGAEDLPPGLPALTYQFVASSNLLGQNTGAVEVIHQEHWAPLPLRYPAFDKQLPSDHILLTES